MPSGRCTMFSMMVAAAAAIASPRSARAECAADDPACSLAQAAETELAAQQFAQARDHFLASIAAKPSARAYLGLSHALEGTRRTAAAYDAIITAVELSAMERDAPTVADDAKSRADAIEAARKRLRAQVALVHLTLPNGILIEEIATVRRQDDGVIADPFTHGVAVAAGQTIDVTLRDGRHGSVVPDVALGGDGNALVELDLPLEQVKIADTPPPPKPIVRVGGELLYATNRGVRDHNVADDSFGGFAWVELHPLRDPFGTFDIALTGRIGGSKHLTQDQGPIPPTLADVRLDQSELAVQGGPMIAYGPVFVLAELGYLSISQTLTEEPFQSAGTTLSTSVSSTTGSFSLGARYAIFEIRGGVEIGTNGLDTRLFVALGIRGFPVDIRN